MSFRASLLAALSPALLFAPACSDEAAKDPVAAPVGSPATPSAARLNAGIRALIPVKPGRNWVFDAYETPNRPGVAWSRFWTEPMDFTGVAWDRPQTLTMISPRHALMAAHYMRENRAAPVRFFDRSGKAVERLIVGREKLANDIAVVLLHEDMPAGVASYAVPAPSLNYESSLEGTLVLLTDKQRKVHVHEIDAVAGGRVRFRRAEALDAGFFEALVTGDSGNPSFLWVRGQAVLLGTHTTGGAGAGPFFGDPENQAAINAAMQRLSEQHGAPVFQLRTLQL